jgi:hypothetical protein
MMKKFLDSRLGLYLTYGVLFQLIWWIDGFQSAAAMFLIYTLAEIEYTSINKKTTPDVAKEILPEPKREPETESP